MTQGRFRSKTFGFEVAWDGAVFRGVVDPADPLLKRATGTLLDGPSARILLLVPVASHEGTPLENARPHILLSTDGTPLQPHALAARDWDEAVRHHAAAVMRRFSVGAVGVGEYHWHGFPMLDLRLDVERDDEAALLGRSVGFLFTPQQTFTLFYDLRDLTDEATAGAVDDFANSFHLIPREREGYREEAHELIRSFTVSAKEIAYG